MIKISNIFLPLSSLFSVDYNKKLIESTELSLYEAKRKYIESAQNLLHYQSEVEFQKNKIKTLTEMVSNMRKGNTNDGIPNACITDVSIGSVNGKASDATKLDSIPIRT